jgi:hypothetical protein
MISEYMKHVIMAIVGALVAIPSIAGGFYFTYRLVTYLGN